MICLTGLQHISLHPNSILLSESTLTDGELESDDVFRLAEEELELWSDWFNWKISYNWFFDLSSIWSWLTLSFNFYFSLHLLE